MSEPARPDPIVALREQGFLIYLLGTLTSNIGSQMRLVAIGWEIYNRTGRKSDLGYVGLVFAVPVLLLALPSGMAADRYPRRSIIMLAQTGLAISGCGLAWVSHAQAPLLWIYLWLFSTGVFRAFGWPASQAIVTGLVPTKIFSNAATWRSVAFQLAWAIGSLCGGVLVARWTPNYIYLVYLIDAASCVVLIVCMAIVKPRPHVRQTETRSWHSLAEGVHFVRRQPLILSTITLDMVAVLFGGATALLPVYAKDILGVGATGFGWLRAMQPLGAIFMSLVLATRPPIARGGITLLWAVAVFGLGTIVFGLSTSFPLSLAALFVMGAADNISVVIRSTVVQLLTPDSMRGRVAAVNTIFIGTSNEIGEFESGMAAEWLGTVTAVAGGGVMTLLTVVSVAAIWPQMVRMGSLAHLEPPEPTDVALKL